jgi:hypothetical protein
MQSSLQHGTMDIKLCLSPSYRSEFVWNRMKRNERILRGLKQAVVSGRWIDLPEALIHSGRPLI